MAFIRTSSKSGNRPQRRQERTELTRQVSRQRDSDTVAWQAKSKGDRTSICLDDMGKALADESRARGEMPSHDKIQGFLSEVGETADKSTK